VGIVFELLTFGLLVVSRFKIGKVNPVTALKDIFC